MKLDEVYDEFKEALYALRVARAKVGDLAEELEEAERVHTEGIREISTAYAQACDAAHAKRDAARAEHEKKASANRDEIERRIRQLRLLGPKIGPLVSSVVAGACGAAEQAGEAQES